MPVLGLGMLRSPGHAPGLQWPFAPHLKLPAVPVPCPVSARPQTEVPAWQHLPHCPWGC